MCYNICGIGKVTTRGQILVAVGLAATVVAIVVREANLPEKEPTLVAEARLRSANGGSPLDGLRVAPDVGQNDAVAGGDSESDGPMGELDDEMQNLPLMQVMRIMSGGTAKPGDENDPEAVSNPEGDWEFLHQADSVLRDPRLQQTMQKLLGSIPGSGSDGE
jgi:hypothetical protein